MDGNEKRKGLTQTPRVRISLIYLFICELQSEIIKEI